MNKYVYKPSLAAENLGLPDDLILEFINDFINQANQDKEELYVYLESGQDLQRIHPIINKLYSVAKNLSMTHILEILSTMQSTTDATLITQNLKSFYLEVSVLKGNFYAEPTYSAPKDNTPVLSINKLLKSVPAYGSSELLLQVGSEPMIRIDWDLRPLNVPILNNEDLEKEAFALLSEEMREELKVKKRCKFTFDMRDAGRFKAVYSYSASGLLCSFQVIPTETPTLDEFGHTNLKELIQYDSGIVITSGASGNGITTTTAMMINEINITKRLRITLLNPEFSYIPRKSLITNIEYNTDKNSFQNAIDDAINHNSDVVVLDNLDSEEKLLAAIKLAENAILVIATTNLSSVERVLETIYYTVSSEKRDFIMLKLSYFLQCIIAQNLLPQIGGGKIAIHDIMINNPTMRNIIKSKNFSSINVSIKNFESSTGMESQASSFLKLVKSKRINKSAALKFGNDFDDIRSLLSKLI